MLKQAIREMEEHVAAVLAGAVKVVATEKLLTKQLAAERAAVERWRDAATAAVAAGDDARARQAIERRIEHEDVAAALDDQRRTVSRHGARLRRQTAALRARLAEAQRRYAVLEAVGQAHRAQRVAGDLARSCAGGDSLSRYWRLEQRLDWAEAEAEAADELNGDSWEQEDDAARRQRQRVEAELAERREHLVADGNG
jgi:phage shock protein A